MSSPKIAAEIGLIKLCKPEYSSEKEALVARIEKLEQQIKTGVAVSPGAHQRYFPGGFNLSNT